MLTLDTNLVVVKLADTLLVTMDSLSKYKMPASTPRSEPD